MVLLALAACKSVTGSTELAAGPTTASGVRSDGDDDVWQVGRIASLSDGAFDGTHPVQSVTEHGDLGLGTFHALDGEMVIVEDVMYRVRADGSVTADIDPGTSTPFAQVTEFEADASVDVEQPVTCAELDDTVGQALDGDADIVALRISGEFAALQTRSVPAQEPPYRALADVVAQQQVTFELGAVEAVLVGFRTAAELASVSPPGVHLHGLTADRRAGGHVLSCELRAGTVEIDVPGALVLAIE